MKAIKAGGFTLVEMMVVIGIISILSAVVFSGLNKWVPNYRLKGAAQELHAAMQRAKSMAIKSNRNVGFEFTKVACPPEGGSYRMFIDDGGPDNTGSAKDNQMTGSETSFYSVNLTAGVCLSATTFTNDRGGFTARGVASGGTGSVTLGHVKIPRTRKVTLLVSGGVKME
ncbi:GspH/FimT family pseudopilin [Desulfosediminicola flagellatus]|uniref:GspH/FimT family pseudopilin n=1 Tax=Desulfosediminicola flagellatus TaxID=2569541 RepID=UPI0010ACD4F1|nr:GspH/FimT family pseudopilin [Desulfosediminicola flagellatus]